MPYADPGVRKAYHALYREKNRELLREKNRALFAKNKEKYSKTSREYTKRRKLIDPAFHAACNLRSRLNSAIKYQNVRRVKSQFGELIGCSKQELIKHLESLFVEGMSWENYSRNGWHIDHIIPLSSFDLSDVNQLRKATHYSNLQPLWAADNIRKSNKVEKDN